MPSAHRSFVTNNKERTYFTRANISCSKSKHVGLVGANRFGCHWFKVFTVRVVSYDGKGSDMA
eukprot:2449843-Amphidinium_carterae.1